MLFNCFMAGLFTVGSFCFCIIKLRTPKWFAKEASQFQCTCWEKHDITNSLQLPMCSMAMVCSLLIFFFFFKPSNWNVRQASENLCTVAILSYADCWSIVHFSCNISCNRSHKARLCDKKYAHHITTAGYTARKFCYEAHCHVDIPITGILRRMNEASFQKFEVLRTADVTRQWKTSVALA